MAHVYTAYSMGLAALYIYTITGQHSQVQLMHTRFSDLWDANVVLIIVCASMTKSLVAFCVLQLQVKCTVLGIQRSGRHSARSESWDEPENVTWITQQHKKQKRKDSNPRYTCLLHTVYYMVSHKQNKYAFLNIHKVACSDMASKLRVLVPLLNQSHSFSIFQLLHHPYSYHASCPSSLSLSP